MMKYVPLFLLVLLPLTANGQNVIQLDTTLADKNCDDFRSMVQAQGYYYALQIMTGEEDADGLDGDGDGIACAAKQFSSIRDYGNGNVVWYEEEPVYVQCETTEGWFSLNDFKEQAQDATAGPVGYMEEGGLLNRAECLHTIGKLNE